MSCNIFIKSFFLKTCKCCGYEAATWGLCNLTVVLRLYKLFIFISRLWCAFRMIRLNIWKIIALEFQVSLKPCFISFKNVNEFCFIGAYLRNVNDIINFLILNSIIDKIQAIMTNKFIFSIISLQYKFKYYLWFKFVCYLHKFGIFQALIPSLWDIYFLNIKWRKISLTTSFLEFIRY